jgi:arylformamidase
MLYRGMDRTQLDGAYNNSAAVPTVDAIRADWDARSARVRQGRRGHLDLAYGDTPRQRLDLFLADSPRVPTLMFIGPGTGRSKTPSAIRQPGRPASATGPERGCRKADR